MSENKTPASNALAYCATDLITEGYYVQVFGPWWAGSWNLKTIWPRTMVRCIKFIIGLTLGTLPVLWVGHEGLM
jgi:hypothetical protein